MNCRKVFRRLSAYIEDDLSPVEKSKIEDHLKVCLLCGRRLADIKLIVDTADQLEPITPGPHFVNRLLCAISQQKQPSVMLAGWRYRLAMAGAAFVVAACMTFLVLRSPSVKPIPPAVGEKSSASSLLLPEAQDAPKGFPVSKEALEKHMSLTENPKADSSAGDTIVLPKHYVQPVGIKRESKGKVIF